MKAVTQQELSEPQPFSLVRVAVKATALAVALVLGSFVVLGMIAAIFGYRYLSQIADTSGKTPSDLITLVKATAAAAPRETNPVFLLLGTDTLTTRGDIPPLTDTMLLASLDLKTGSLRLLPLPRDIWNEAYKTKINALYAYGLDRNPDKPEQFPHEVLQEMTGVPIDYTIVIDMNTLSELVDSLSGIAVPVPTSFIDDFFPNPEVDISTERDPKKLYKTVTFVKGTETMSGERFLEFIRSRHSDSKEGTDLARSERQQIALTALMQSMTESSVLKNPNTLGKLLALYEAELASALPLNDIVGIGKTLAQNSTTGLSVTSQVLSVQSPTKSGVLIHPDARTTNNIWLYTITDQKLFAKEVGLALNTL